ncbi:MAG TPA: ferritin-like domain-containing protein [Conexibacter sp.]|nr:ferritin-like domain-containing protein [Conexibacter sp.]
MQDPITLEALDRDGAIRELGAEAQDAVDATETAGDGGGSAFPARAGMLAGGALALGAIPLAFAGAANGLSSSDVKILNYALTLEYLEAAFYTQAVKRGKLSGNAARFAKVVAGHEAMHVRALKSTLGSKAVKSPRFDFMGTTADQATFLRTAMTLEDTGVSAYQGQAPKIASEQVLAAAGAILAVEARHAAWVRYLLGQGGEPSPAPDAFNPPMSMSAVLSAVRGTGFIK